MAEVVLAHTAPCPQPSLFPAPRPAPCTGPRAGGPSRLRALSRNQTLVAPGPDAGWEKHRGLSGWSSPLLLVRVMNEETE